MSDAEKWDYLQDVARYELERMQADEAQGREEFEEWAAAEQNYLRGLGV